MFYLQLIVAGLGAGGAYALSSVGLVMIYKATRVINFAQGAIGMVGVYVFAQLLNDGQNYALAAIVGLLTSGVLGLLCYALVIFPLRNSPGLARMIATFGIVLLLQGVVILKWGQAFTSVEPISTRTFEIGSIQLSSQSLVLAALAMVATVGVWYYYDRRISGKATDAASTSPEAASRLGYNVPLLGAYAWVIGSLMAGAAGILISPTLGLDPNGLTLVVVGAMVGGLVGSFERIWFAVMGSFALGMLQSLLSGRFPSAVGIDQAVPLALVVILLLFGAQAIPSFAHERERLPMIPAVKIRLVPIAIAAAFASLAMWQFSPFWLSLTVQGAGLAIIALSLVLILGYGGQISLMQWPLAGLGAFVSADLLVKHQWSPPLAILLGALVTGSVALVIGLPALRMRGVTLAIVTLSTGVAMQSAVLSRFEHGYGFLLPPTRLFGTTLSPPAFACVAFGVLLVAGIALYLLRLSWLGRRLIAVRSSERASLSVGLRTYWIKTLTFAAGGAAAGVGGALWTLGTGVANAESFDPITGLLLLSILYINGIGSISAGVVTGFSIAMGPTFLTNTLNINGAGWFSVVSGILLVLTLILNPDGALVSKSKTTIRLPRWVKRSGRPGRDQATTEPGSLPERTGTFTSGSVS